MAARILVVDDDPQVRSYLESALADLGYVVDPVESAEAGLDRIRSIAPDLVFLDLHLPGRSGEEALEEIRENPMTRLTPVIMMTGAGTREDKLRALGAGVTDFVEKPFDLGELTARVRSLVQLKLFTDELEQAENVIISLARAIDARDPCTAAHSERVSLYAGLLGERIGLRDVDLKAVRRGGLFHDVGKIVVPDTLLQKAEKLSAEEYELVKRHPIAGREILRPMKTLAYALPVVYHHHERYDGSGYPEGVSGEEIPITARVTTLGDVYDALTTARPYRGPLPRKTALEIMNAEAKRGWWDRHLLDEFRAVLEQIPETRHCAVPQEKCHP